MYYNESCGADIGRCAGMYSECDNVSNLCDCPDGFAIDSTGKNCALSGFSLLNDSCGACQHVFEQTCQNGVCACMDGMRPATTEEILASFDSFEQCRDSEFSLGKLDIHLFICILFIIYHRMY